MKKYHITYYYCTIYAPTFANSILCLRNPINTELGIKEAYEQIKRIISNSGSNAEPTILNHIELTDFNGGNSHEK